MIGSLEADLLSFEASARRRALERLAAGHAVVEGDPGRINLHVHSFFSFNAEDWSPSRIAWEAARRNLYAVDLVDFDVLDGRGEFLDACGLLGLRGTVALETRTFHPGLADKVIDSPGEPGVSYVCAAGFATEPAADSPEAGFLRELKATANARNRALVGRVNDRLDAIAIDHDRDVLPLSPGGTPTERHIVAAYITRSREVFRDEQAFLRFWAGCFGKDTGTTARVVADEGEFRDRVRAALAKRGGIGYVQPTGDTFPRIDTFFAWARACGAIPMESWLDGTSKGERDPAALLESSRAMGAAALNLIPDRNWNIKDPAERATKTGNLHRVLKVAEQMGLPVHIGTEMNRKGQPFFDSLEEPELRPWASLFLKGAQIFAGQMILARFAGFPYIGPRSEAEFGPNLARRNTFFAGVGALPALRSLEAGILGEMGTGDAFNAIADSARAGRWILPGATSTR